MSDEMTPEADWLAAIAAGGAGREVAVRALWRAYRSPLLGWLRRRGAGDDEAEDLLQDAFVKLTASAGSYRGDGSARGWIYAILRNQWLDHLRRHRPEVLLDDDGWAWLEDTVAADTPSLGGEDDCVRNAFTRFGREHPERAEALRRMVVDGWSVREVAGYLQRTERATFEYLSQCRKKLRPLLQPCLDLLGQRP